MKCDFDCPPCGLAASALTLTGLTHPSPLPFIITMHKSNNHGPSLLNRLPATQRRCPQDQWHSSLSQVTLIFLSSFCIGHSGASLCSVSLVSCICSLVSPLLIPRHREHSGGAYAIACLLTESQLHLLWREAESNPLRLEFTRNVLSWNALNPGSSHQHCWKPVMGSSAFNFIIHREKQGPEFQGRHHLRSNI